MTPDDIKNFRANCKQQAGGTDPTQEQFVQNATKILDFLELQREELKTVKAAVEQHKKDINANASFVPSERIRFDALLKEVHNADQLVENHSRVSLMVSAALFAFAGSQFASALHGRQEEMKVASIVAFIVGALGIVVCIVWWLKVQRHADIFTTCFDRLTEIQLGVGLVTDLQEPSATRPKPERWYNHGFKLMYILVCVFVLLWLALMTWAGFSFFNNNSANQDRVEDRIATSLEVLVSEEGIVVSTARVANEKLDGLQKVLNGLGPRVEELQTTIDGIETSLEVLVSEEGNVVSTARVANVKLDGVKKALDGLGPRVEKLQTTIDDRFSSESAIIGELEAIGKVLRQLNLSIESRPIPNKE